MQSRESGNGRWKLLCGRTAGSVAVLYCYYQQGLRQNTEKLFKNDLLFPRDYVFGCHQESSQCFLEREFKLFEVDRVESSF